MFKFIGKKKRRIKELEKNLILSNELIVKAEEKLFDITDAWAKARSEAEKLREGKLEFSVRLMQRSKEINDLNKCKAAYELICDNLEKQFDLKDRANERNKKEKAEYRELSKKLKKDNEEKANALGKLIDEAYRYGEHLRDEPIILEYLGFESTVLINKDSSESTIFSKDGYSLGRGEGKFWIINKPDGVTTNFQVGNMLEMITVLQALGCPVAIETVTKNTEEIDSLNKVFDKIEAKRTDRVKKAKAKSKKIKSKLVQKLENITRANKANPKAKKAKK